MMFRLLKKIINSYSPPVSIIDSEINGEMDVLSGIILNSTKRVVIFDVGANKGDYTELALTLAKDHGKEIELHLFEPQATNFSLLKDKFELQDTIFINHVALSDVEGTMTLYTESAGSALGSLYKRSFFKEQGFNIHEESVHLTTAEIYLKSTASIKVDLLKIDVEGHEYRVIKGLGKVLDSYGIKNIQFEYGGTYKDAGVKLKDVFDLLSPNYNIGKIEKASVDYMDYHENLEDHKYANYLAALKK